MIAVAPPPSPNLEDAFWRHFNAWQFVQAEPPEAGKKPDWKAVKDYPLARRMASRGKLIAVRPKTYTSALVIDLDALSRYHPRQNPYALSQLQQALEDRLGLAECILLRSSDSGGLHLWYWFEEDQNAYHLADAVAIVLKEAGFVFQPGHLETFPNCKTWIDSANPEDWSQYHAIRVPFQEPGSYLLDPRNDYRPLLHPLADQRQEFLKLVKHSQRRNAIARARLEAVLATKPKQVKRVSVSGNKYLSDLLAKVRDGWTGQGQTNQLFFDVARLLRIFGHLLLGVAPLWEVDRLAAAILDYIQQLPGREQFCGHNHELEARALEWANWVQSSKYKPYDRSRKTQEAAEQQPVPRALTYNQQQQQTARERILQAITVLLEQGHLPATTSARIEALEALGVKRGTLYRHRDLWHPENLSDQPEPALDIEFTPVSDTSVNSIGPKPNQGRGFTPITPKELVPRSAAPLEQAQGTHEAAHPLDFSREQSEGQQLHLRTEARHEIQSAQQVQETRRQVVRAARGAAKYAQMQKWLHSGDPILVAEAKIWLVQQPEASTELFEVATVYPTDSFAERQTPLREVPPPMQDLNDLLAAIDCESARLQWQPDTLRQFCLDKFGKIRSCMNDDELISLLLALRGLELHSSQALPLGSLPEPSGRHPRETAIRRPSD